LYLHGDVDPYFNLALVAKIMLNLAFAEIGYTIAHTRLHNQWAHLHIMHHCCIHNSTASNFIIHPLDLVLEFFVPAGAVLVMNEVLLKDHFAAICSIATMLTWYLLDHDVLMELPHAMHHKFINTVYSAYINVRTHHKNDVVAKTVKRVKTAEIVPDTNLSLLKTAPSIKGEEVKLQKLD
jgi:hypothetical protein